MTSSKMIYIAVFFLLSFSSLSMWFDGDEYEKDKRTIPDCGYMNPKQTIWCKWYSNGVFKYKSNWGNYSCKKNDSIPNCKGGFLQEDSNDEEEFDEPSFDYHDSFDEEELNEKKPKYYTPCKFNCFSFIPQDIMRKIAENLKIERLLSLGKTSKIFVFLNSDDVIWQRLCFKRFGDIKKIENLNWLTFYKDRDIVEFNTEYLRRYKKLPETENGKYFKDANLKNMDLKGVDLTGVNFENGQFCDANLYQTNFTNAILVNVSFRGATLFEAIFCGADLRNAHDFGTAIYDAKFDKNTNFEGAFGWCWKDDVDGEIVKWPITKEKFIEWHVIFIDDV